MARILKMFLPMLFLVQAVPAKANAEVTKAVVEQVRPKLLLVTQAYCEVGIYTGQFHLTRWQRFKIRFKRMLGM